MRSIPSRNEQKKVTESFQHSLIEFIFYKIIRMEELIQECMDTGKTEVEIFFDTPANMVGQYILKPTSSIQKKYRCLIKIDPNSRDRVSIYNMEQLLEELFRVEPTLRPSGIDYTDGISKILHGVMEILPEEKRKKIRYMVDNEFEGEEEDDDIDIQSISNI